MEKVPGQVHEKILGSTYRGRLPQFRGYMSEALFLERNPAWGYVRKPNATQHDVYLRIQGRRTPFNGQVKYHDSGKPARYVADMLKDSRADWFLIPDDHVKATRAFLQSQATKMQARGDRLRAARLWRDYGRVRPMGANSNEIRSFTREADRLLARERYSTYTSLGASLAMALGPTVYEWQHGDLGANVAAYRAARSLSILGVGLGTDLALRQISHGALRGTGRGNVVVGTAIAITETVWLLHDYGWHQAFYQPEFYEQAVGGVTSLTLALAVGTYATLLASETGPILAPLFGFGAATLAGTAGYLGGREATRAVLEIVSPELLRQEERERVSAIKSALDKRIVDLQRLR